MFWNNLSHVNLHPWKWFEGARKVVLQTWIFSGCRTTFLPPSISLLRVQIRRLTFFLMIVKGQIKPKADWHAVEAPKKQTNKQTNELICFVCFFAFLCKQNKFVRFLGESTKSSSCFWFYLTFIYPISLVNGDKIPSGHEIKPTLVTFFYLQYSLQECMNIKHLCTQ